MKILGIDLGKYKSVACLFNTDDNTTLFFTFQTQPEELKKLLGLTQSQQVEHVLDATGEMTLSLMPIIADSTRIAVEPWCFQPNRVTVMVEGRLLKEKSTDEPAMRDRLATAPLGETGYHPLSTVESSVIQWYTFPTRSPFQTMRLR